MCRSLCIRVVFINIYKCIGFNHIVPICADRALYVSHTLTRMFGRSIDDLLHDQKDTGLFPPVSVSRPPSSSETSLCLKRHLLRCRCGRSRCRRPPRLRHLRRQDDLRAARVPPPARPAPAVPAASLADVELLLVTVVVEPRVITTVLRAFSGGQAILVPHIVVRFTVKPVPGPYLSVCKKPRTCRVNGDTDTNQ